MNDKRQFLRGSNEKFDNFDNARLLENGIASFRSIKVGDKSNKCCLSSVQSQKSLNPVLQYVT